MEKTNLEAVKNYIAENGVFRYLNVDWLESTAKSNGLDERALEAIANNECSEDEKYNHDHLVAIIKEGLDKYNSFESLYTNVLMDRIGYETATELLAAIGEYLSEEDKKYLEYDFCCFVN